MLLNKSFRLALLLGKYPFSIFIQKFICICVYYKVKRHIGLKIIYFLKNFYLLRYNYRFILSERGNPQCLPPAKHYHF